MTQPTITRTHDGRAVLRFPYDQWLVESLKDSIPSHARAYDPVERTWTVTPAYVAVAVQLMLAVFPDVDLVDQSSTGSSDRAPHAGDAYRVLHLLPSAPPELVTAAHRCLAKLNHPDRGGSTVTMQRINAAVEAIREAS